MRAWVLLLNALLIAPVYGIEVPDRIASTFNHTKWLARDGIPSESTWLAQSSDGWLWLGGASGLTRFDGVTFERVEIASPHKRRSDAIYGFYADEEGSLWMGHEYGGISRRLADGSFRHYGLSDGMPEATVTGISQDASGAMYAVSSDLLRLEGQHWRKVTEDEGLPEGPAFSIYPDQYGTLWIAHAHGIFYRPINETKFRRLDRVVPPDGGDFLQSPDGRLWYIDRDGVRALTVKPASKPRSSRATARRWSVAMFDRHGDLWTMYPELMRIPAPVPDELKFSDIKDADTYSQRDGLSSAKALSLIEDREGTIWVATPAGLDRFRRTNVHPVSFDERPYFVGMVDAGGGAIWVGMYIGVVPGPKDGLWKFDGELKREAPTTIPAVTAIHRDARGVLWIGAAQGLWKRHSDGEFQRLPALPAPERDRQIHALTVDAAGDLWAAPASAALYRFREDAWQPFGNLTDLPQQRVMAQALGADGRMWFGYLDGSIAAVRDDRVRVYAAGAGLRRPVSAISAAQEIFVAAREDGVFVLDREGFQRVRAQDPAALVNVSGILQLANGDLWLNGIRGAVRIDGRQMKRAILDGSYEVPLEVFDTEDGYPGIAQDRRPMPTITQGSDGKIWIATSLGAAWLQPDKIHRNVVPPSVYIRSVTADQKQYQVANGAQLPKGTRDFQVSYTALSLARPERVRFRYRLEGYDSTWTDAGNRREAYFTNLPPGTYRFAVLAANPNGIWSKSAQAISIQIPALFVQTRAFAALCVAAAIALLGIAYALRVRYLTARERSRLEERLVERERIARELHDTLLQGVQGIILGVQAVADQIASHDRARVSIEQALQRADALLIEGRERVKNLRTAVGEADSLRQALLGEAAQLAGDGVPRIVVTEQGAARSVHPIVHEEVMRIAAEALTNAVRHAVASRIDVELCYASRSLMLTVRDDGQGVAESVLGLGREGHFGLMGMRERANRIGGELTITSLPGAGTRVTLVVPARVAFVGRSWWRGFSKAGGSSQL